MLTLAYTVSPELRNNLNTFETLRKDILLTMLSPKLELQLRFRATCERIHLFLGMREDKTISLKQVVSIVSGESKRVDPTVLKDVLYYKRAYDSIRETWLVSDKLVQVKHVEEIATGIFGRYSHTVFSSQKENLKSLLTYLQARSEHPLITAGLAYSQLLQLGIFEESTPFVATLLAYLFLYKDGYDLRGLLVLEKFLFGKFPGMKERVDAIAHQESSNDFLFYFVQEVVQMTTDVFEQMKVEKGVSVVPSHIVDLNERQKAILTLLEVPEAVITNKKVQREFHISQITSSRDLAKLVNLGLLFPHGKGRSVYYTKV